MRNSVFIVLLVVLIAELSYYYVQIIPKTKFQIPAPVQLVLEGKTPIREVYQHPELFKEVYNALGNETPIGVQFDVLFRRFYPKQKNLNKKDNSIAPAYYTLNDWALAMLEYIPFKDLPNLEESWKLEVTKLMYQGSLKPIYGLENNSNEGNTLIISKWKSLLEKYFKIGG